MEDKIEVIVGDKGNPEHMKAMLDMLDLYMQDEMGGGRPLQSNIAFKNVEMLKAQSNYVFFLPKYKGEIVGIANCFVNFSTFKAKQLINIHDFAVSPRFRRKGIGRAMMSKIFEYARENDFCKVTLEVRNDNHGAQKLYREAGFQECEPPMHFWEREV